MIRARTIWAILGITATVIATTALAAWLLGRVASDRFGWSQWLQWMPTPVLLPAVGLGVVGACQPARVPRRRRRRLRRHRPRKALCNPRSPRNERSSSGLRFELE